MNLFLYNCCCSALKSLGSASVSTRTSLYVLEISVAGDPSSLLQGGLPTTAVLLLPDCKDGTFIAEELKGCTPEDLKPAMIIAGITDCNQAFEKVN